MVAELALDPGVVLVIAAAMVGAGLIGGFIAGLLGVGGGIVIVPVLYQILAFIGTDDAVRMQVAVGTSLATIVVTSVRSARAHHRRGAVDLALLQTWIGPVLVGVVAGAALSAFVSGRVLEAVFAFVALIIAGYMLFGHRLPVAGELPRQPLKGGLGLTIGGISTLMGIGGGTLSVPVLSLCSYPIRKAVGTAAAIGLLIAVPGTVGFVIAGWSAPGTPPGSIGFVNLLGFAAIVPATIWMAPLGARTAHRISRRILRVAFALFLLATSVRMFSGAIPF